MLFLSGAIFTEDQKNSSIELAFKYAVYKINKERELLPNTTLVYDIQYVPRDDSFRTFKKGKCNISQFSVLIFLTYNTPKSFTPNKYEARSLLYLLRLISTCETE